MDPSDYPRRLVSEFAGTTLLLIGVVGSGITAERMTPDPGLQLLAVAAAVGALLVALIFTLGPVSGAHLNPVVTLASRFFGGISAREALGYVTVQLAGGALGVIIANLMFDLPAVELSTTVRSGAHLWLGEVIGTFGLILVVFGVARSGRASDVAFSVGAYIAAACFFTSSACFVNPAFTVGRILTDTFTGIEAASVPAFLAGEIVGMFVAIALVRHLYPTVQDVADDVVLPH